MIAEKKIKIGNKFIGDGEPCYIIAEAGVNHNGSTEMAKKLIDAAVVARVDAVKFQTFKAENLTTTYADKAEYQKDLTDKAESQQDMLKGLELRREDFSELKKYADGKNIEFLSTPHSGKDDVDLLVGLGCNAIKVGSGDLTNMPFLKYIAQTKLPIILSTGMSTLDEVEEAVKVVDSEGNNRLILLHCTTSYPTKIEDVNLRAMLTLKKFGFLVGYSDHTEGIKIPTAAVALGAHVIEKHFTLDRNLPGPDHKASLEPAELKKMVSEIRKVEQKVKNGDVAEKIISELDIAGALGDGIKKPTAMEIEIAKVARKSIVAARDISADEKISESMLAIKRPGTGLNPRYFFNIVGKTAKENIKKDELVFFEKLS